MPEPCRLQNGLVHIAALALLAAPASAYADSTSVLYIGHDLGLSLEQALTGIQATGGSRGRAIRFSVSGAGDQLEFTEVNGETIETESASYKALDFNMAEVRRVGDGDAQFGITLRAAPGAVVHDHVLALSKPGESEKNAGIDYMDFWLVDPDMSRSRHLADLFATLHARQGETAAVENDAPAGGGAAAVAPIVHNAAMVMPAPQLRASRDAAVDAEEPETPAPGKCLIQADRKPRRGHAREAASRSALGRSSVAAGNGRLSWHVAPPRHAAAHQEIAFSLTNMLPIPATLVARVILTSSSGDQQAEELGAATLGAHATRSGDMLTLTPFADDACVTDVDVTVLRACPLADDTNDGGEADAILACNEDAAAGTKTVNGITYVAGREPKSLAPPQDRKSGSQDEDN